MGDLLDEDIDWRPRLQISVSQVIERVGNDDGDPFQQPASAGSTLSRLRTMDAATRIVSSGSDADDETHRSSAGGRAVLVAEPTFPLSPRVQSVEEELEALLAAGESERTGQEAGPSRSLEEGAVGAAGSSAGPSSVPDSSPSPTPRAPSDDRDGIFPGSRSSKAQTLPPSGSGMGSTGAAAANPRRAPRNSLLSDSAMADLQAYLQEPAVVQPRPSSAAGRASTDGRKGRFGFRDSSGDESDWTLVPAGAPEPLVRRSVEARRRKAALTNDARAARNYELHALRDRETGEHRAGGRRSGLARRGLDGLERPLLKGGVKEVPDSPRAGGSNGGPEQFGRAWVMAKWRVKAADRIRPVGWTEKALAALTPFCSRMQIDSLVRQVEETDAEKEASAALSASKNEGEEPLLPPPPAAASAAPVKLSPRLRILEAVVMVADISGFTPLTETLSKRGTSGVELLTRCMNNLFTLVMDVVAEYGGEVIKFAGDSMIILFIPGNPGLEFGRFYRGGMGDRGSAEGAQVSSSAMHEAVERAAVCAKKLTGELGSMRMLPDGRVVPSGGVDGPARTGDEPRGRDTGDSSPGRSLGSKKTAGAWRRIIGARGSITSFLSDAISLSSAERPLERGGAGAVEVERRSRKVNSEAASSCAGDAYPSEAEVDDDDHPPFLSWGRDVASPPATTPRASHASVSSTTKHRNSVPAREMGKDADRGEEGVVSPDRKNAAADRGPLGGFRSEHVSSGSKRSSRMLARLPGSSWRGGVEASDGSITRLDGGSTSAASSASVYQRSEMGKLKLSLKVAVAAGELCAMNVGGVPETRGGLRMWDFLVSDTPGGRPDRRGRRPPYQQIKYAECQAEPGDVMMSSEAFDVLVVGNAVKGVELKDGSWRLELMGPRREGAVGNGGGSLDLAGRRGGSLDLADKEGMGAADLPVNIVPLPAAATGLDRLSKAIQDVRSSPTPGLRVSTTHSQPPSRLLDGVPRSVRGRLFPLVRGHLVNSVRHRVEAGQLKYVNEVRICTVVFMGFPSLSDPSTVMEPTMGMPRELSAVQQVYAVVCKKLTAFDGALLQFRCDEKGFLMIGAFGLPLRTHEDDPARAVEAAVAVRAGVQAIGHTVRIGVTTGQLFCACVGSARRTEYTLFGDSINLSARLMCRGMPLEILTDYTTYKLARRRCRFSSLEPIMVKGKKALVRVFKVVVHAERASNFSNAPVRLTSSSTVSNIDSSAKGDDDGDEHGGGQEHPPLIGRHAEVADVIDRLSTALFDGTGEVVVLEGAAGVGKSSLMREIHQRLDSVAGVVVDIIEARGEALSAVDPLAPWQAVFRHLFQAHRRRHPYLYGSGSAQQQSGGADAAPLAVGSLPSFLRPSAADAAAAEVHGGFVRPLAEASFVRHVVERNGIGLSRDMARQASDLSSAGSPGGLPSPDAVTSVDGTPLVSLKEVAEAEGKGEGESESEGRGAGAVGERTGDGNAMQVSAGLTSLPRECSNFQQGDWRGGPAGSDGEGGGSTRLSSPGSATQQGGVRRQSAGLQRARDHLRTSSFVASPRKSAPGARPPLLLPSSSPTHTGSGEERAAASQSASPGSSRKGVGEASPRARGVVLPRGLGPLAALPSFVVMSATTTPTHPPSSMRSSSRGTERATPRKTVSIARTPHNHGGPPGGAGGSPGRREGRDSSFSVSGFSDVPSDFSEAHGSRSILPADEFQEPGEMAEMVRLVSSVLCLPPGTLPSADFPAVTVSSPADAGGSGRDGVLGHENGPSPAEVLAGDGATPPPTSALEAGKVPSPPGSPVAVGSAPLRIARPSSGASEGALEVGSIDVNVPAADAVGAAATLGKMPPPPPPPPPPPQYIRNKSAGSRSLPRTSVSRERPGSIDVAGNKVRQLGKKLKELAGRQQQQQGRGGSSDMVSSDGSESGEGHCGGGGGGGGGGGAGVFSGHQILAGGALVSGADFARVVLFLVGVINRASLQRPVVLLLDDVHLFDSLSVEVLLRVASDCPGVFIVASTQGGGGGPSLQALMKLGGGGGGVSGMPRARRSSSVYAQIQHQQATASGGDRARSGSFTSEDDQARGALVSRKPAADLQRLLALDRTVHRRLGVLNRADGQAMCFQLLSGLLSQEVLEPVIPVVYKKASGHPMYIEQICVYLLEYAVQMQIGVEGADRSSSFPGRAGVEREKSRRFFFEGLESPVDKLVQHVRNNVTIHSVVTARVDQLDPSAQLTLKVASVVGLGFDLETLHRVHPMGPTEESLRADLLTLQAFELVAVGDDSNAGGGGPGGHARQAWRFLSPLTRDVTYQLLPFNQRRELHRSLAGHLEEVSTVAEQAREAAEAGGGQAGDAAASSYEAIAFHCTVAAGADGAQLHGVDDVALAESAVYWWERAAEALLAAPDRLGHGSVLEVIRFYDEALRLADLLEVQGVFSVNPDRRATWNLRVGAALVRTSSDREGNLRAQNCIVDALEILGVPPPPGRSMRLAMIAGPLSRLLCCWAPPLDWLPEEALEGVLDLARVAQAVRDVELIEYCAALSRYMCPEGMGRVPREGVLADALALCDESLPWVVQSLRISELENGSTSAPTPKALRRTGSLQGIIRSWRGSNTLGQGGGDDEISEREGFHVDEDNERAANHALERLGQAVSHRMISNANRESGSSGGGRSSGAAFQPSGSFTGLGSLYETRISHINGVQT